MVSGNRLSLPSGGLQYRPYGEGHGAPPLVCGRLSEQLGIAGWLGHSSTEALHSFASSASGWHRFSELIPFAQDLIAQEGSSPPQPTVAELLDEAFEIMRRRYPVEYVYKACLLKRLLFGKHSPRTTSCYFELPVGTARRTWC